MALIMLVLLSMIAVSATRSANSSIRIVGNMQIQDEIESAAQASIEGTLGNVNNFTSPADQAMSVSVGATSYTVTVYAPTCINAVDMPGNSVRTTPPKMNYYDVKATVVPDNRTGATATVHQGVRIALPAYQGC